MIRYQTLHTCRSNIQPSVGGRRRYLEEALVLDAELARLGRGGEHRVAGDAAPVTALVVGQRTPAAVQADQLELRLVQAGWQGTRTVHTSETPG